MVPWSIYLVNVFLLLIFKCMCFACFCVSVCHVCTGAHRGQKRPSNPLELGLQALVSHPVWVLGSELGSSVRAIYALTHEPSLQPHVHLLHLSSVASHLGLLSCTLCPGSSWPMCPLPTRPSISLSMLKALSPEPIITQLVILLEQSFSNLKDTGLKLNTSVLQLSFLTLAHTHGLHTWLTLTQKHTLSTGHNCLNPKTSSFFLFVCFVFVFF
jgi:hypothetical protein